VDPKQEPNIGVAEEEEQIQGDEQRSAGVEAGTAGVDQSERAEPEEEVFEPETADRNALIEKCGELERKLGEAEERVLRTVAEADNFKKRIEREKQEQNRYANEAIIRDLLPVLDNLERALEHCQAAQDQEGLLRGLEMTLKAFTDTLAKFGCLPVEAVGREFDPNFHEAVGQEERSDCAANTVLRQLQKGYLLRDRLLRAAMVIVSKAPDSRAEGKEITGEEEEPATGTVRIKVNPE
jgi:molecular chaperone GrpE